MKIYVLIGSEPYEDFCWVHDQAFRDRLSAEKESYSLTEASKDEETGDITYYRVEEIDLA